VIGRGTFADVRAAEHRFANMRVAVKIINKTKMDDRHMERARNEIETLKLCQHPNVMRLYDVFENADYLYLVVEILSGGNLFNHLKDMKFKLPEDEVRRYVHSIAHALEYMHRYGIVHRDIKPDNVVLVSPDLQSDVKIVDFGLATILGVNELAQDPVGTLCYAAPELLLGQKYGKAVDVWSLGVLTYYLLSGRLPFNHDTSEKQIAVYVCVAGYRLILNAPLKYCGGRWDSISAEGKDFVQRMMPLML
jgi:serine/threonine protein kinase